jgi:hypothetical protein
VLLHNCAISRKSSRASGISAAKPEPLPPRYTRSASDVYDGVPRGTFEGVIPLPRRWPPGQKLSLTVACDRCHKIRVTIAGANPDELRAELKALQGLECARAGKGRDRWDWWCASCNPELRPPRTRC